MKVAPVMLVLSVAAASLLDAQTWRETLSPLTPGAVTPPRAMEAVYEFGWSGVKAAEAKATYSKPDPDVLQLDVTGRTTGMARTLWKMDAKSRSLVSATTLRPISVRQTETYRSNKIETELDFGEEGVARLRKESPTEGKEFKRKKVELPDLLDLHSALLFIRGQELAPGKTYRVTVYPTTKPYLAEVKVLKRETIKVGRTRVPTWKIDLKLQEVNEDLALERHKKFKSASAWVSDDRERMLLRVEAEVFIGSVWMQLQRVQILE